MQQTYATGFETTFTTPFGMDANHPPTHSDSGPEPLRGKSKLQINLYLSQKKKTVLITISTGSKLFRDT